MGRLESSCARAHGHATVAHATSHHMRSSTSHHSTRASAAPGHPPSARGPPRGAAAAWPSRGWRAGAPGSAARWATAGRRGSPGARGLRRTRTHAQPISCAPQPSLSGAQQAAKSHGARGPGCALACPSPAAPYCALLGLAVPVPEAPWPAAAPCPLWPHPLRPFAPCTRISPGSLACARAFRKDTMLALRAAVGAWGIWRVHGHSRRCGTRGHTRALAVTQPPPPLQQSSPCSAVPHLSCAMRALPTLLCSVLRAWDAEVAR